METTREEEWKRLVELVGYLSELMGNMGESRDWYDPYGTAMEVAFNVADALYHRGDEVPPEWKYRAAGNGVGEDPEEWTEEVSSPLLTLIGNRALEVAETCKRLGIDY